MDFAEVICAHVCSHSDEDYQRSSGDGVYRAYQIDHFGHSYQLLNVIVIVIAAQVTGGANDIGRAICEELAKCGCNVAVVDVDLDAATDCCKTLHSLGVKAFPYEVNTNTNLSIEFVNLSVLFPVQRGQFR